MRAKWEALMPVVFLFLSCNFYFKEYTIRAVEESFLHLSTEDYGKYIFSVQLD